MTKSLLLIILLVSLTSIWGFQWEDRNQKIRYQLEIISKDEHQVTFDVTVFLAGESILLNDQRTPYITTIEASDLECLVDAADPVRIILTSREGRTETLLRSAYIKAENGKKRILGM
jgi:hypothetical protein